MIKIILVLLVSMAILTACATPYQERGISGGYSDVKVGKNRYIVSFQGNGFTSAELSRKYVFKRAKELCKDEGYTDFETLDGQEGEINQKLSSSVHCSGTGNGSYNNRTVTADCTESGGGNLAHPNNKILITCTN
jgi:hypothetical protein